MAAFRFTPDAVADRDDIWQFIASDNDRVEEEIFAACEALARNPLQGHVRPDLTKLPVRFWTLPSHPNYMVVYRPETSPLQILRVLHGKRNVRRILKQFSHDLFDSQIDTQAGRGEQVDQFVDREQVDLAGHEIGDPLRAGPKQLGGASRRELARPDEAD